ncbi:hypothetical protein V8G54_029650 [Vigna mungo]|uniref:Uncharacterized protein n=1 Tax=Vigna mungo TaxID=3915 RepID=A0AAQ3MVL8_VIGMU
MERKAKAVFTPFQLVRHRETRGTTPNSGKLLPVVVVGAVDNVTQVGSVVILRGTRPLRRLLCAWPNPATNVAPQTPATASTPPPPALIQGCGVCRPPPFVAGDPFFSFLFLLSLCSDRGLCASDFL